jgi:aspartate/methionine/tyrosine aminotransferase
LRPDETRTRASDMSAPPSSIASSMPVSGIREIMELAWKDPEVIHLEVGEPDFPTPEHVVDAAHEAARRGHTRYAPNAGLPELREALADKVTRRNGFEARTDQVVVTQGGIQALYLVLLALLEPGDEVLLPDPAWPNFRMIAHLLGARAVLYPLVARGDFLPRLEDLERLVTPRTRAILVNSPSNPLGTVVPRELLQMLLAFARQRGLWFVSDEVYDEVVFDDLFVSAGSVADTSDRLVSIYSFSKVYAMTGWRVGYLVAPPDMAKLLTGMQEPIISCVNTPRSDGGPGRHDRPARRRARDARGLPCAPRRAARGPRSWRSAFQPTLRSLLRVDRRLGGGRALNGFCPIPHRTRARGRRARERVRRARPGLRAPVSRFLERGSARWGLTLGPVR